MYKRILVINLMYIGDLLFTTPLLRTLRNNYPNADIIMLADAKNCDVIKYNPHLSEIIAIDKKGYHNKLKNYLGLIAEIRRRKFDLVINLHRNERASAIAAFSGATKVIGFAARCFNFLFDEVIPERTDIHQVDAYLETMCAAGVKQIYNLGLEMWVDDESESRAEHCWQGFFTMAAAPVIGFNTGGSWLTKRWISAGFAAVADKLLLAGFGVAFFGGPMDRKDVEHILSLMTQRHNPNLAVITGKTTLLEMAALVNKCAVLLSGDSGPMHIAVARKIPVVAVFGPSDRVRYAPYKHRCRVITASEDCLACGKHQCDSHKCMTGVSPEIVFQAIMELL